MRLPQRQVCTVINNLNDATESITRIPQNDSSGISVQLKFSLYHAYVPVDSGSFDCVVTSCFSAVVSKLVEEWTDACECACFLLQQRYVY